MQTALATAQGRAIQHGPISNRSYSGGRIYYDRSYHYQVIYESVDGETGVFGETDSINGGWVMYMARLIPWVKTTRVVRKESEVGHLSRKPSRTGRVLREKAPALSCSASGGAR